MAFARRISCWLVIPCLVACSAVSPDPSKATIDDLPVVALDDGQVAVCTGLEGSAVDAVVRRRYEEAEAFASRALAINPRSARARAVLAMVKLQMASRQRPSDWFAVRAAEVEMELAQQLSPKSAFVGWMHAVFLAESGHMSAAAAAAEAALVRSADAPISERAALLGTAGTYRYELGEERAARPHLEAYISLRPDDSAAHFRLGSCLLSIAKTPQGSPPPYSVAQAEAEAAAVAFSRCFQLAPGDEDAALAVATAWIRAAELADLQSKQAKQVERDALYDQAVTYLKELAVQFPANAEVYFRIGVLASMQKQPEAAHVAYLAALDRDRNHLGSLLNLASLMIADGEVEPAKSLLLRVIAAEGISDGLTGKERERIVRWLRESGAAATKPAAAENTASGG
ncbi:MAG: tetratricopeptide (TPR) repeat protein [Planctomycetota bacterium]|jgi:tetratricopeptide (TPR) repeat protein